MSRRRRRHGGNKVREEQWFPISYPMAHTPAFRSLSGAALKVWIELRTRFNGGNNGQLHLSLDEAAHLLGLGKATVQRALKELEEKGFIVKTRQGQWYGRMATQWRTTDKGTHGNPPTYDWKRWVPSNGANPKKQSFGSKTDHNEVATGPLQNRGPELRLCSEPVEQVSASAMGSGSDRLYNHSPAEPSRRAEPLGERSATASGGTTGGLSPIGAVLPGALATTARLRIKRGAQ
jgi:DNA-binding HxlR family transcriptional regulator